MTDADRRLLVDALGRYMAEISEDCYASSWDQGIEDRLPRLAKLAVETGRSQRYGMGGITPAVGRQLLRLAELAGSWAVPAGDAGEWQYEPHRPN